MRRLQLLFKTSTYVQDLAKLAGLAFLILLMLGLLYGW